MKIVIDIPEDMYNDANILTVKDFPELKKAIANGIPLSKIDGYIEMEEYCKDMNEDTKQASIPYTYNSPQFDWKCGYPNGRENRYYKR